MGNYSSFKRKWLKRHFFELIRASTRFLGYAYMKQIKKKGIFGSEMEGMKRKEMGFSRKKNFRRHGGGGRRQEIFQKKFFWNQKIQNCERTQLRLAPPAFRGGSPTLPRKNGKFAANKATQTAQTF